MIVGSGSNRYKKKLERWIIKNGLKDIISIYRMDAKEALKNIDILVVPSTEPEGFGRTIVEAQMAKTPVIATDIGAVPELVEDGKTGLLVKPNDADGIATCIENLIKDRELYKRISEEAKGLAVERFSLEKMVKGTLSVYKELL